VSFECLLKERYETSTHNSTVIVLRHFGVGAGIRTQRTNRCEVIEKALATMKTNYIFPETAQKMDAAVRERMARVQQNEAPFSGFR
jgi:predicted secreted Zn-dependent protease